MLEEFQKVSPHNLHELGLHLLAFDLDSGLSCAFLTPHHAPPRE